MAFHNVRFPTTISKGSKGGPTFSTSIATLPSGGEQRNSLWAPGGRFAYLVNYGIKTPLQAIAVRDFIIARQGPANSFRYKDFRFFSTDPSNSSNSGTYVFNDESLGVGDGVTTQFQLYKTIVASTGNVRRKVTKPVLGSVLVGLGSGGSPLVPTNQGSGWTVDYTTGILAFSVAPGAGYSVTWGGEFDMHVRAEDSIDQGLIASLDNFSTDSIAPIPFIEVVDETVANEDRYYGSSQVIVSAASITLSPSAGLWAAINMTATSLAVYLPDPSGQPFGPGQLYILNNGSNSFAIMYGNTTITTLAAGSRAMLVVQPAGVGSTVKQWYAF